MPSQFGFRLVGEEVVLGVQRVVAQEFERIAVETVRARLGDRVHYRAAEFSIFRVKAVGDKAELFHRIEIRNQPGSQISSFADVAAIHQKRVGRLTLAIHRDMPALEM